MSVFSNMTEYSRLPFLALLVALLVGCGGDGRDDPLLCLSAEEALDQGTALMAEKKYQQAKKYLIHAFEVEPNSASGRDGLLFAADSLYFAGGETNLTEAETRYRDFLNRFPTSERSAYAQYRIASTLAKRMEKPNRDQQTSVQAVEEFEDLLRLYPTTEYATEARDEMKVVQNNLAEAEYRIGAFYMRYGCRSARRLATCRSASARFEFLLDNFPEYTEKDKALYQLCRTYAWVEALPEGATDACTVLTTDYASSPYTKKVSKHVKKAAKDKKRRQRARDKAGADSMDEKDVKDALKQGQSTVKDGN